MEIETARKIRRLWGIRHLRYLYWTRKLRRLEKRFQGVMVGLDLQKIWDGEA